MTTKEKMHEIEKQFSKYLEQGNKGLIEEYTLQEIKDTRYFYKHDNSRETDIGPVMDDRIKEIEKISDDKSKKKEKLLDRTIAFICVIIAGLVVAYLKGCFQLK